MAFADAGTSGSDPTAAAPYHLDLTFRGTCLVLRVAGADGDERREHLAEVTKAAEQCGLPIIVTDDTHPPESGMLA